MPAKEPDLSSFHRETELVELRRVNSDLQAKLRRATTSQVNAIEAIRHGSRDAALVLGNPPAVPKPKVDKQSGKEEVALLHCSDWHFGANTVSFDLDVAAERVRSLGRKVTRLAAIERADHPVRCIHVLLAGDMVEGVTVFPGQGWEVKTGLLRQLYAAVGAGVELLRHLAADFESIEIWEEAGNHGRIGKRGDVPKEDNIDLLVYGLIRERTRDLEDAGRVVWHESTHGWHSIVEIGDYRALLVHGDEVRSFGGQVPAFGIAKKVNAWATGVVAPFTDCMMGHFHQPLVIPLAHGRGRVFVNPSIESDSIYAQEFVGATGTPGQRLNFINPRAGRVTSERIIWLDD